MLQFQAPVHPGYRSRMRQRHGIAGPPVTSPLKPSHYSLTFTVRTPLLQFASPLTRGTPLICRLLSTPASRAGPFLPAHPITCAANSVLSLLETHSWLSPFFRLMTRRCACFHRFPYIARGRPQATLKWILPRLIIIIPHCASHVRTDSIAAVCLSQTVVFFAWPELMALRTGSDSSHRQQ